MSAARRGGPPSNAAARGGVLILVAVVIGALLLSRGFSEDGGLIAAEGDDTTETTVPTDATDTTEPVDDGTETTDTSAGEGTEDTTPTSEVRPNNEIRFTVLNGSGVSGAAGSISTELNALNYVPVAADNVPGSGRADESAIYYVDGWQAEAQQVATDLGVDPSVARSIAEIPFEFDPGDATILVVLGVDEVIAPS
ncbi:LytR C-terminal domain-containing protein [Actinomarinicola tropica]|uniref:LytR/CpsA/Psr regulator C-terminal domain-containing protein n=1 Tax=Actinomarinicola tropica TaxID=2789776 RepID=A0A5Q2RLV4_9ACTN|nr:LytR C-terminal domain-containing protein [Actinomarinicola tropica]QGG96464.1 hypothetical protein GH723_15895 [Actinomarinicola tropica]